MTHPGSSDTGPGEGRGQGRPQIGVVRVKTTLTAAQVAAIDAMVAAGAAGSRAEAVRILVGEALGR